MESGISWTEHVIWPLLMTSPLAGHQDRGGRSSHCLTEVRQLVYAINWQKCDCLNSPCLFLGLKRYLYQLKFVGEWQFVLTWHCDPNHHISTHLSQLCLGIIPQTLRHWGKHVFVCVGKAFVLTSHESAHYNLCLACFLSQPITRQIITGK